METLAEWFCQNNREGNLAIIEGKMGSGKSNFACLLIEDLIKLDFDIITNIRFSRKYKRIFNASLFSEFLEAYINIEGNSVLIFDDAETTVGMSIQSNTKKAINNNILVKYIRKYQSNLIYIAHIEEYIPRYIYSFDPLVISKSERTEVEVFGEKYEDVPATRLKLETYSRPAWTYDIDLQDFDQYLTKVPQDQIKSAIKEYLKDPKKYDALEDKKKDILFWLLDNGYPKKSPKEIFPSYYVWKKEWNTRNEVK